MLRILVVLVMFSLPFIISSGKKKLKNKASRLWFALRWNSKRECRKWRETVTDLENGCLGPEAWGLWQSAPAPQTIHWKGLRSAHAKLCFQKAVGARNNWLHHYLIITRHRLRTALAALRAVMPGPKLSKVSSFSWRARACSLLTKAGGRQRPKGRAWWNYQETERKLSRSIRTRRTWLK